MMPIRSVAVCLTGAILFGAASPQAFADDHPHPKTKPAAETPAPKAPAAPSPSKTIIKTMTRSGESAAEQMQPDEKTKRVRIMKAGPNSTQIDVDESGMKTIVLTGETVVKIGDDGTVVIMNGDEVIDAAGFTAAMQGRASANFVDMGEAAKIQVDKSVMQDSNGRRIRVVIEMETEAE